MGKSIIILFLVMVGMIAIVLLTMRGLQIGNPPNTHYFDAYQSLMPGNEIGITQYRCLPQDAYGYPTSDDNYYYCPNVDEQIKYISINEHQGIINYVTFGTRNLRYGDLIAMFGQPTYLRRSQLSTITTVHFGSTYALVLDRNAPIGYDSVVTNIAFKG